MTRTYAPSGAALSWGVRAHRRTGPKPALTVDAIVAAAIRLADDGEGLATVTMDAVSRELGCTKPALYRHVNSKDDLVAVMFDTVIGRPRKARSGDDWRTHLRRWATQLYRQYRAHPWTAEVPLGAAVLTRNRVLWLEAALAGLADAPLTVADRLRLVLMLNGHVAFTTRLGRNAPASADAPEPELLDALARSDLPHVHGVVRKGLLADRADERAEFNWGLTCILNGAGGTV